MSSSHEGRFKTDSGQTSSEKERERAKFSKTVREKENFHGAEGRKSSLAGVKVTKCSSAEKKERERERARKVLSPFPTCFYYVRLSTALYVLRYISTLYPCSCSNKEWEK